MLFNKSMMFIILIKTKYVQEFDKLKEAESEYYLEPETISLIYSPRLLPGTLLCVCMDVLTWSQKQYLSYTVQRCCQEHCCVSAWMYLLGARNNISHIQSNVVARNTAVCLHGCTYLEPETISLIYSPTVLPGTLLCVCMDVLTWSQKQYLSYTVQRCCQEHCCVSAWMYLLGARNNISHIQSNGVARNTAVCLHGCTYLEPETISLIYSPTLLPGTLLCVCMDVLTWSQKQYLSYTVQRCCQEHCCVSAWMYLLGARNNISHIQSNGVARNTAVCLHGCTYLEPETISLIYSPRLLPGTLLCVCMDVLTWSQKQYLSYTVQRCCQEHCCVSAWMYLLGARNNISHIQSKTVARNTAVCLHGCTYNDRLVLPGTLLCVCMDVLTMTGLCCQEHCCVSAWMYLQ